MKCTHTHTHIQLKYYTNVHTHNRIQLLRNNYHQFENHLVCINAVGQYQPISHWQDNVEMTEDTVEMNNINPDVVDNNR